MLCSENRQHYQPRKPSLVHYPIFPGERNVAWRACVCVKSHSNKPQTESISITVELEALFHSNKQNCVPPAAQICLPNICLRTLEQKTFKILQVLWEFFIVFFFVFLGQVSIKKKMV